MKIRSAGETRATAPTRKPDRAKAAFSVKDAPATTPAKGLAAAGPVAALGALIDLQSEGGGRAKALAASRRALDLLESVRLGLLDGRVQISDLDALAQAAEMRAGVAGDPALEDVYDEIALRARVELAKFGR
ncbi:MAG: flagellar assembly protein FliX [Parvularculaceae bacterium]